MTSLPRIVSEQRYLIDGNGFFISVIETPTINDVLETEARIYASSLGQEDPTMNDRIVPRSVKDLFIKQRKEY